MADSSMAGASKVVFFFLAFCVALVVTGVESGLEGSEDRPSVRSELEQLRSKVVALGLFDLHFFGSLWFSEVWDYGGVGFSLPVEGPLSF